MRMSLNGSLVLKPYKGSKELKDKQVNRGFVGVENKSGVDCLELLIDAYVNLSYNESRLLEKGSKVYFKESTLQVQKWPQTILQSEELPEGFVVGNITDVLFVEDNKE